MTRSCRIMLNMTTKMILPIGINVAIKMMDTVEIPLSEEEQLQLLVGWIDGVKK